MSTVKKPKKASEVYVVVIERKTQKVVKRMGPMSMTRADRVAGGVDINLDHENYYVLVKEK